MISAAEELGISKYFRGDRVAVEDDHIPFAQCGIPSLDIIDIRYQFWHTPDDSLNNISMESLDKAGRVVERMLEKLDK